MPKKNRVPEVHYYEWSVSRWRGSLTFKLLNATGKGIFRELLDQCYDQGSIPVEPGHQALIAGCTIEELHAVWPSIKKHFQVHKHDPEKLVNCQAETARRNILLRIKTNRSNGNRGGRPQKSRIEKTGTDKSNKAIEIETTGLEPETHGFPDGNPITKLNVTKPNLTELNLTKPNVTELNVNRNGANPKTGMLALSVPDDPQKRNLIGGLRELWKQGGCAWDVSDENAVDLFTSEPLDVCVQRCEYATWEFTQGNWRTPGKSMRFYNFVVSGRGKDGAPKRILPRFEKPEQTRSESAHERAARRFVNESN